MTAYAMKSAEDHVESVQGDEVINPLPRVTIQIFAEMPEFIEVAQQAAADRHLARAVVKVHSGGIAAAMEFYRNASTPNIIILECNMDEPALKAALEQFAEVCDMGTKVVVVGKINDVVFYRDMIRSGLSDYLVGPVSSKDLIRALSNLYAVENTAPLGKTIAFIAARGGAGSSTFAHNVAWALSSDMNHNVVLADLDIPFGTAGLDFNQDPEQGIVDAIAAMDRLDQTIIDRLMSKCTENLHMLAAPAMLDRAYDLMDVQVDPMIEFMKASSPYVILDVPHMWTNWVKQTVIKADKIVIVATPDLASMRNTKNILDILRMARPNDEAPLVVLNQVGIAKRPEIRPEDFSKALSISLASVVPFDAAMFGQASNNGQMIGEMMPKSATADMFRQIAMMIAGKAAVKVAKPNTGISRLGRLFSKAS